ncbi:MAG: amidohydrolase family protein [Halieaceae bacterium]|jgi:L-fuconolactonase|nr:amidohydrolase family protein [Halieaceae bacterium]
MTTETPWLKRTTEAALEPELPICDPHHHLWEFPTSVYLVDELLEDLGAGHNVTKTVYVECNEKYCSEGPTSLAPVGETEFVQAVTHGHQRHPQVAAGIVGFADLCLGSEVVQVLEAHKQASSRFRGIRHASAWHESTAVRNSHSNPTRDLLQNPDFLAGFSQLKALDLRFDAWMYFEQIPQLTALARAFPDTPIVLNHVGGPIGIGPYAGQREQVFERWRAAITELSACENVYVKLGGMAMTVCGFGWHKLDAPPGSKALADSMAPYFHTCIEHFGPWRCMFESNFPVDRASCSYTLLWNAFKRVSQGYSKGERAGLFYDNACRFYAI